MLISHEEVIWLHFERNTSPILRQLILSFKCQFPLRMKYESTPKQILPPFWGSEWKPLHLWGRFRHFVMNLKWNEGHQSGVQGYMRADNRFQNIRWPKRYFLRPILFLHPLSEGRGTRLTIRQNQKTNLIMRRAGLSSQNTFLPRISSRCCCHRVTTFSLEQSPKAEFSRQLQFNT